MPHIEASFFEHRFENESFSADMVDAITRAVSSVIGEEAGKDTSVVLHSIPPSRWGHGGNVLG